MRGWLQGSFQLSITAQIISGLLAITALVAAPDTSGVLRAILWIETVMNAVQFLWYITVYWLSFLTAQRTKEALDPRHRYWDWVITTPIMLVTLMLLTEWWYNPCRTLSDIYDTNFVIGTIMSVLFNLMMLAAGASVAWGLVSEEREEKVLAAGFVPFLFAFFSPLVVVASSFTMHAFVVWIVTVAVWSLYGFVSILYRTDLVSMNVCFNLLDIVAKNVAATAVAIFALAGSNTC